MFVTLNVIMFVLIVSVLFSASVMFQKCAWHIRCHHSHQPIHHHRHSLLTMPSCHSSDHALKDTFHDLHQLAFLKLRYLLADSASQMIIRLSIW